MKMINTIIAIILSEKELKVWLVLSSFTRYKPGEMRLLGKENKYSSYRIRFFLVTVLSSLNSNKTKQDKILTYSLLIYDVPVTLLRALYSSPHLIPMQFLRYGSYYFPHMMRKMNCGNNFYRVTQIIRETCF